MPPAYPRSCAAAALLAILCSVDACAYELILNDPFTGTNAAGISQARCDFIVTDPLNGNNPVMGIDPWTGELGPARFTAFVDTGASGFAISALHVATDPDIQESVPQLGLGTADFVGIFTETGVGGLEVGKVSRPVGIAMLDGQSGDGIGLPAEAYTPYGAFSLWIREDVGTGEFNELLGYDPINLIGMPVIRQRRMWMTAPYINLETFESAEVRTTLLAQGTAEPATNLTLPIRLQSFIHLPPPGEVLPSYYDNPLVVGMTVSSAAGTPQTGDWLFDTGAQSTILAFTTAKAAGLIPASYSTLAEFMVEYVGPTTQVGGIGAPVDVPLLTADEIRCVSMEGIPVVWKNVTVMVIDVAGLPGIFGMNLLVPAITPDPEDPLGSLFNISPIEVGDVVFDATNSAAPELRLQAPGLVWTYANWRTVRFGLSAGDEAVAGPAADPDGDGFSNELEFGLGGDPTEPDAAMRPVRVTTPGAGPAYLIFEYTRANSASGVTWQVEVSNDLVSWRSGTGVTETESISRSGGRLQVRERILETPPSGRVFARVSVVPTVP